MLDEAVEEAKKKLDSTDKEEIEKASSELTDKLMPIGAKLYEQATPKEDASDESKKEDGPVEGEVVDDKKEEK